MASPSTQALLIVDIINPFNFKGSAPLLRNTRRMVPRLVALREHFDNRRLPVIYCNDNFGQWRSDFRAVVASCAAPAMAGAAVVVALAPRQDDYFVLKMKHSAFFATPLHLLLQSLGVRQLFVAGIAGDGCVLNTATDAHILEYETYVVSDAVASQTSVRNKTALSVLEHTQTAQLRSTPGVARLLRR